MISRRAAPDVLAVSILCLLWALFFWRLLTPNALDRTMLIEGDFSGQFVAFGAYQFARLDAGEIPLWNPYNNGGLPFIGDTQAALFYPPRLLTMLLVKISGAGWTYQALQVEMMLHVLGYSLAMYLFVRRITQQAAGSHYGAFAAATIAAYGGFLSGYPPLQLALLEAAVWLPLALLGLFEATRKPTPAWGWVWFAGVCLGVSWLAGHPQTSFFSTYLLLAYLAFHAHRQGWRWRHGWTGALVLGLVTVGIAAVLLLPGLEYLSQTARTALGFDAKGNGFPFQDVVQFLFPAVVSLYSPLYIGVSALVLAGVGLLARQSERLFWGCTALVALGLSFGANSVLFHALYAVLPGLSFFRGQERAAFLVSVSLAVLAGTGLSHLSSLGDTVHEHIRRMAAGVLAVCGILTAVMFALWLGNPSAFGQPIGAMTFSTLVAGLLVAALWTASGRILLALVCGLIVFELFSVNMDNVNYRPADHDPLAPSALVQRVQADQDGVFRVDGDNSGLPGNYGSLYQLQDMRGISPLFLDGPHGIIERELPSERDWEVFAVRYVISRAEALPAAAERLISAEYRGEPMHLHRLTDPRPFALLVYDAAVVDSDAFARALLADPAFNPRSTIILEQAPGLPLPDDPPAAASAVITAFTPEHLVIQVSTPDNALLSLAMVDYVGWRASLNGQPIERLRAYGALTALMIPAGDHQVELVYDPVSFRAGAFISLTTLVLTGGLAGWTIWRRRMGAVQVRMKG